jgi:nicotinate phosphoribosyltransferase
MPQRENSDFPFLPAVLTGETADIYFLRTRQALAHLELDPHVGMEIFPGRSGIVCGTTQVAQLLHSTGFDGELYALEEGASVQAGEVAMQLRGRYSSFGVYETAILGTLASSTGWATAAREVVEAAGDVPVTSFGARHVHPNVAAFMDYAAIIAGCVTCSTPLGAALAGTIPSGTMPHAYILIVGDTLDAACAFDKSIAADIPRIVLVDTFQDETVESLRVGHALGNRLDGVRLDTPRERGGVTPALVRELRARLDAAGLFHVQIYVSGGISPDRIRDFRELGARIDGYGVGSYISAAAPIDYTADIREIEGAPIAKRGRIPGMSSADRLHRVL